MMWKSAFARLDAFSLSSCSRRDSSPSRIATTSNARSAFDIALALIAWSACDSSITSRIALT